jgi:non-ribosomal peptide synthetase component E (peptide arylation enzyme)
MSETEMANLKSSAQVCDYCKSEHGSEAFSMNHVITEEHLQWYKAVTNEDDVELPLKLCDNSYSMLKSRYDNHIAKEEVNISPGKQVLLACGEVFLGYVLLVTFIILGALPIWAIESYSERSAVQEQFNTIPANYTMKWNYGASVYYTMVTMTTIGYGDMSPSTRGTSYL